MRPEGKRIWSAIETFDIDGGEAALTFEKRLAGENGWSLAYAKRVVGEYRRFVFLAMFAGHPVTPSDAVDQAWHLHMTYTDSYWRRLCDEVLPRPLHHNPTKGGEQEGAKFDDWYRRTLESYARLFGEAPPPEVWPAPEARFDRDQRFVRVNLAENWVVPKEWARRLAGIAGAIVALSAVAGCGVAMARADFPWALIGVFVLMALIVWAISRAAKAQGNTGGCAAGCGGAGSGANGCGNDGGSGCGSGCGGGGCGGGCGS